MSSSKAWVTLATNDSYSLGALVLAHSLKAVKTAYKLAILITPGVTAPMKQQIEAVFDDVKTVDVLDSKDQAHLTLMSRPELGVTFTKLHCWTLTDYEKCVFLDADTLVLQNCDELFEREELSAAPDPGWPDCFNTGVFVYKPSQDTFNELLEFARTRGSFDGGDQGLLNMFFKDWAHTDISKHLSFTYNVVWSSTYSYLPALKQFGQNMKIVHFIASSKPWLQSFNTETRLVTATSGGAGLQTLLQLWWDLFCRHVHPKLSTEMIENRLSSRYSYDSHSDSPDNHTPNNTPNNSTFNNHYAPTCDERPNEDSYDFVDPWDEYLVASDQKENCETVEGEMCENRWTDDNCNKGDGSNAVEVCSSDVRCENDTETMNYSFRMNVIENRNGFGDEERNDKRFDEVREVVVPVRELGNENRPACSDDDIPINPNSSLSVNNCRPDSPTHCEVHTDMQTCISDGGLAGQFARISLNEKTADQKALEDFIRRQSWEQGNMDYLGKDSFSNIWAKINETLGTTGAEVKSAGADVVKTVSPPQVVHAEEPRPLKSALKKTSTSTPPVESELIDSSGEPPAVVKLELEKLDLSGDNLKGAETPETPAAVTSPAPPITPAAASRAQQSPKPESIGPGARGTECAKELGASAETETECAVVAERPDGGAAIPSIEKDTAEPEVVTAAVAELEEGSLPGSESSASKSDEPVVKETCQEEPAATGGEETAQPRAVQSSAAAAAAAVVDSGSSTTRLDGSDDAPVAPKRTNKGNSSSNAPKNVVKPSEEK